MKDFIVYIPGGFPNLETTKLILQELNKTKITAVEVGIPFSDPVADGPVIEAAHHYAVTNGVNLAGILDVVEAVDVKYEKYLMSYLNPIMNYQNGVNELTARLKKDNFKGLIIPDLPIKELENLKIDFPVIPFLAPNTQSSTLEKIKNTKAPFVYYIGRFGVTGQKTDMPFLNDLAKVKKQINAKIYMGFGISNNEHVKNVWNVADGAIVGSAIVSILDVNKTPQQNAEAVTNKVKELLGS